MIELIHVILFIEVSIDISPEKKIYYEEMCYREEILTVAVINVTKPDYYKQNS